MVMLKYLTIQLCDTAPSFCHYANLRRQPKLISEDILRKGIRFAMQHNLSVQVVFPSYELPEWVRETLDATDYVAMSELDAQIPGEVLITTSIDKLASIPSESTVVLRTSYADFFAGTQEICHALKALSRLNIVITDVASGVDSDAYQNALKSMIPAIVHEYLANHPVQINLLTDRMMLKSMQNCNAGTESITLAPDGNFYLCPAFYLDEGESVGNLATGITFSNQRLLKIENAPICKICDAFQCNRCHWLNSLTTHEVNTPSHEQCVKSHIERNVASALMEELRKHGEFLPEYEIPSIDYLDPFDKLLKNK